MCLSPRSSRANIIPIWMRDRIVGGLNCLCVHKQHSYVLCACSNVYPICELWAKWILMCTHMAQIALIHIYERQIHELIPGRWWKMYGIYGGGKVENYARIFCWWNICSDVVGKQFRFFCVTQHIFPFFITPNYNRIFFRISKYA